MMQCNTDALSLFLDGELPVEEHRRVAEHLHACGECRENLARIRRLNQILVAWGGNRHPIPDATEARVHRSILKRKRMRAVFALGRMMPAALGTSVAAVLVLLTVNLTPLYRDSAQPTPSASSVAAKSLKRQSKPLFYQRVKSAVVGTHTGPQPNYIDRHPELGIY